MATTPNHFEEISERQRQQHRDRGECDGCPAQATHFGPGWQVCEACERLFDEMYEQFITGDY